MTTATIDHNTLARLVEANVVRGAQIVGQLGGWGVVFKYGATERALAATRSKEIRIFRRFETLVDYLREIGISRFNVDAANFDAATDKSHRRPDTSAKLKQAHAALVHDKWFREQVAQAIEQADDPTAQWVSNETVVAESAKRRAALRKRGAVRKRGGSGG